MFKNRAEGRGIRGNFEKKNANLTNAIPKISLGRKFHPNRIIGKGSKIGGRLENVTN